ncbi:MAG TPA: DUF1491 family protein [Hyphomicrobiaceae bacterium]|nr:DUF1491 family protein [Hyphomicrobiaceae bacterium]
MRLKAQIWVHAYLRICTVGGASVVVVRHGDDDAGAVFIKQLQRDGTSQLYGPAPAGLDTQDLERAWSVHIGGNEATEAAVDAYLERQISYDPDIWILEIEDREGRHFLESWLRNDKSQE